MGRISRPPEHPVAPLPSQPDPDTCRVAAESVLGAARAALADLQAHWDPAVVEDWTVHITRGPGRVVLSGMGKSGLVAQKIAATLASTGCPSLYLHPAEALHGDLGMVTPDDTVLMLSNSGETEEVVRLLPSLLRLGVPLGAITARPESRLGKAARWIFPYALPEGEGCPLSFAPMASTTLQLVWGDLLAAHRMAWTGFTLEGFAQFHPAGSLGAKLLLTKDLMSKEFPTVAPDAPLVQVLGEMTRGRLGMTTVQAAGRLVGVVSDGDIRRALERAQASGRNPLDLTASDLMTAHPITADPERHAVEAAKILEARKITFLVVTLGERPVGVLHIHHLLEAKVL